jgi:hypothetical protein
MTPATLAELKTAWLAAKEAETAATEERRLIEEAMLAHLPTKIEGTVTDKDAGISVQFKVTRKVDTEKLQQFWSELPEAAHVAFRWKAEANTTALKSLQEVNPQAYQAVIAFITTSPAKPAFSIKD